jgi:hypothetical protein
MTPDLEEDLRPYLETEPIGPEFQALLETIPRDPAYTVTFLVELNQRLAERSAIWCGSSPGCRRSRKRSRLGSRLVPGHGLAPGPALPPARHRRPLRLGLPDPARGRPGRRRRAGRGHSRPPCLGRGVSAGCGWIGLDPTSGLLAGEGHIPLAASPRPDHAAPITGTAELPALDFGHEMTVSGWPSGRGRCGRSCRTSGGDRGTGPCRRRPGQGSRARAAGRAERRRPLSHELDGRGGRARGGRHRS